MHEPLILQLLEMAERWASAADCTLADRKHFTATVFSAGRRPEQRAMLAAACELFDLVAAAPEGVKIMQALGLEPTAGVPPDMDDLCERWAEWCATRLTRGPASGE